MRLLHTPRIAARCTGFLLLTVTTLGLMACGVSGLTFSSYPNTTIAVSPSVTSMQAGASQTFTATLTNNPTTPFWDADYGSLNGQTSTTTVFVSGNSVTYVAPAAPPVSANQVDPTQQGKVHVTANGSTGLLSAAFVTETISVLTPSVTAGLAPATASVALGGTAQFYGYAVGAVNNNVTFSLPSGSGTITSFGYYTAPATMPMSGPAVTLTLTSAADATKTATATITLH